MIRRKKSVRVDTKFLSRLESKALIPHSLNKSLQETQVLFDEAGKEWEQEKIVAQTKRKQFLEQFSQDMEDVGDGTKEKNIRKIIESQ